MLECNTQWSQSLHYPVSYSTLLAIIFCSYAPFCLPSCPSLPSLSLSSSSPCISFFSPRPCASSPSCCVLVITISMSYPKDNFPPHSSHPLLLMILALSSVIFLKPSRGCHTCHACHYSTVTYLQSTSSTLGCQSSSCPLLKEALLTKAGHWDTLLLETQPLE